MKMKRGLLIFLLIISATGILAGVSIWYFYYYEEDHWLAIDREDALILERLAREGNGEACFCLSQYYFVTHNPEKSEYWLKQAAVHGDKEAQFIMYSVLQSVAESRAIEFLKRSALQDYFPAQTALGREYHAGKSIPRDPEQAEFWYRKAIQNGASVTSYYLSKLLTETRTDRNGLVEAYKLLVMEQEGVNHGDGELSERSINEQKAVILKKASHLGYRSKSLVRQAESMAATEMENVIIKDLLPQTYFRCRELVMSQTRGPSE